MAAGHHQEDHEHKQESDQHQPYRRGLPIANGRDHRRQIQNTRHGVAGVEVSLLVFGVQHVGTDQAAKYLKQVETERLQREPYRLGRHGRVAIEVAFGQLGQVPDHVRGNHQQKHTVGQVPRRPAEQVPVLRRDQQVGPEDGQQQDRRLLGQVSQPQQHSQQQVAPRGAAFQRAEELQ